MENKRIGLIGLGMIGGSLAKAFRLFLPSSYLVAFDTDKEALLAAKEEGVVDEICDVPDGHFSGLEFIFLCAPVISNESYLPLIRPYLTKNTVLTDVGSVKEGIHEAVRREGLSAYFIGGHPMAGSEKTGFSSAKPLLFENAYYVLTPEEGVPQEKIDSYRELVTQIHAIPLILDPSHHDEITAVISHLPHIIASGLVNYVKDHDDSEEHMRELVAGGFRDITRIASSSPVMWRQICVKNSVWISRILGGFMDSLGEIRALIEAGDEEQISRYFSGARDYRDSIPDRKSGPIAKTFVLYCDIIDEAGGIATIATILATNGISIKNVGIIHNREFEEGVLRIEFYDEVTLKKGCESLERHHYTIYTRD